MTTISIPACNIRPGDMLDLQGDVIADPQSNNEQYAGEYMEVFKKEEDGDNIKLTTNGGEMIFTKDHRLTVQLPRQELTNVFPLKPR